MSLFDRKIRGFRLVDVVALGVLVAMILVVYLAKTMAGSERAEIASIERQIEAEKVRIRLLQAEVAHLEQPARVEALATAHLGMAPVEAKRETTIDKLGEVALGKPKS
ncbi:MULTISPECIES: cell division protein FtsL [Phenylobacterium]|uniref:Cell division protein FtsL n=1 Tax=Phenylobacterium koreense TaxID=266125 RepID=A0ABV2EDT3_9CAUL